MAAVRSLAVRISDEDERNKLIDALEAVLEEPEAVGMVEDEETGERVPAWFGSEDDVAADWDAAYGTASRFGAPE